MSYLRMPSDQPVPDCWRCRELIEDAARYQIRPGALRAWREDLKARAGWCLLVSVIVAAAIGLGTLGFTMAMGDGLRIADIASGFFLGTLGSGVLGSTFYLAADFSAKLLQLKREKEGRLS